MATLVILLISFGILFLVNKLVLKNKLSLSFVGRGAMSALLFIAGTTHFTNTEAFSQMLPDFLPLKDVLIYSTGVLELAASAGLLIPRVSRLTSMLLIIYFVSILPANIIGSIKQVNFGGMENGVIYLYFRIPLQLLFISWTYYFGLKMNRGSSGG